ncbi:MAG: MATE family efflux transporter [Oscillospiraceae bacterium]|nr:MATE family efflux transporter [Oscillospiraceae bacterium]
MPGLAEEAEARPVPSEKERWAVLLRLSWPGAVELTLGSLIGMATMILVSSIGKEAVSAVGITGQPIMIPWVAIQAFSVGGMALVARAIGQGSPNTARNACEQTMLLSLIFSITAGLVLYIWGGRILLWMGATPDYYGMAELYMRYSAVGVVFQSISSTVACMLRSAGQTRLSMYFSVAANIANVLLGLVLINGFWFIPALGILGAAIAQLAAKIIGCAMSLYILFTYAHLPVCPSLKGIFKPDIAMIKRICRIGTSSAAEQLALRVGLIAFTIFVINLGTAEYAAHNIAGTLHGFVVNFGSAVGMALVSVVGQNLGAKRPDIAEQYFSTSIKMCVILSVFLSVPLLVFPGQIALLFTREPDVIANIVTALRILAFFTTTQILQISICGGLRGGGDTKWPLISTMTGVLGGRMVLGYVFIVLFGWGIAGAWLCWLVDQTARAVIIYFRYRGGKWKTIKI